MNEHILTENVRFGRRNLKFKDKDIHNVYKKVTRRKTLTPRDVDFFKSLGLTFKVIPEEK